MPIFHRFDFVLRIACVYAHMSITTEAYSRTVVSSPTSQPKMPSRGRQRDHSVSIAALQSRTWRLALHSIARRRLLGLRSETGSTSAVYFCVKRYTAQRHEFQRYLSRSNRISLSEFSFNFNSLTGACCLSLFRFTKHYLFMMMTAVGWDRVITKRNRYACSPLLVTCLILRRLTTPCIWRTWSYFSDDMVRSSATFFGRV